MSIWGMWGYAGLVAALVVLVAITVMCLSWLTARPMDQPQRGEGEVVGDRAEHDAPGARHAA